VVTSPGGHDKLRLVEETDPEPSVGEVRVQVRAAGVNFADTIVREGYYTAAKGQYPITPGFEFAGSVDAVGPNVNEFRIGDNVFGFTKFGGYASVQVARPGSLRAMPPDWAFHDCAALPAVQLTAYHALFNVAKITSGEVLLVHSAAGGVGLALLQQARIAGCRTVAVVGSGHKKAVAERYGAGAVLVRGPSLWSEVDALEPEGLDVVLDANGITTLRPAFSRLKPGGRLLVYGFAEILPRGRRPWLPQLALNWLRVPRFSPLEMTHTNRAVMGLNLAFLFANTQLAVAAFDAVLKWISQGLVMKPPVTTYPIERAADAHKAIESGETSGKIVLTFD
jgi:synaptic vesicle membrane protein VAT-1